MDYVINLHFPGKPKLFIHRVGRCARAGRRGTAYSIFSTDDLAHVLDLHLFLNHPFDIKNNKSIGVVPNELVEEEHQLVMNYVTDSDIANIYRVSINAYKQYINTRPAASSKSNKKIKNIKFSSLQILEDLLTFKNSNNSYDIKPILVKENLLTQMKKYRPPTVSSPQIQYF